jgi:hypothetical protein
MSMSAAIVHFDTARAALAKAHTFDEVKEIRDKASALAAYVRQAGESLEMQNQCAEIKLRAERRAGEMLREMELSKGAAEEGWKTRSHDETASASTAPTLSGLGISKSQSSRWQTLAALPAETFEAHIAETKGRGEELTTAGALRVAKEHKRQEKRAARRQPAMDPAPQPASTDPFSFWLNQIFTADARDLLPRIPAERVDLVLTDPPYNIRFAAYDVHRDNMPAEEYIDLLKTLQRFRRVVVIQYPEETMRYVVPALGTPDHVGAWCYNSNIPRRFRLISYYGLTPDCSRLKQPYKNPTDRRVREMIQGGSEGTDLYEWWTDIQLVKNVSQEKGIHPCPVPVRLMERIILLTTEPGQVVLDPFVGEGTTAEAAFRNGRSYIGMELSPAYAEAARQRLALVQPPLAIQEAS